MMTIRGWRRACLAGAAALGLAAGPAAADTVSLVTGNEYRPYVDENLREGGMIAWLVREAYERAGHTVETIDYTAWNRAYQATLAGHYTAIFPYVPTPKRRAEMHFSDPVYTTEILAAVRADSGLEVDQVSDLHGLTYCTPSGYSPGTEIEDLEAAGKVKAEHPYKMLDCLRLLDAGRVDFIPMEAPTTLMAAKEAFGDTERVAFGELVLETETLHLLFSKDVAGSAAARDAFNAALAQLKASGRYQEIVDDYLR
jgi:polar amino acid transport system substrate-binding protein